jgi:hypothetical protein
MIFTYLIVTFFNDQNLKTLVQHNYCNGNKFEGSPNDSKFNLHKKRSKNTKKTRKKEENKRKKKTRERKIANQRHMFGASICRGTAPTRKKTIYNKRLEVKSVSVPWRVLHGQIGTREAVSICTPVYGKDDKASVCQVLKVNARDEPRRNCNDSLILVEKISNESDRLHVADSVGIMIINKHPIEIYTAN